jgi:hypothetical protein
VSIVGPQALAVATRKTLKSSNKATIAAYGTPVAT